MNQKRFNPYEKLFDKHEELPEGVSTSTSYKPPRKEKPPATLDALANLNTDNIDSDVSEDEARFDRRIARIQKFRAGMIRITARRASYHCNECKGIWHGRFVGEKKKLWLHCDGTCGLRYME